MHAFSKDGEIVYFLPTSVIRAAWSNDTEMIYIDTAELEPYRVAMNGGDQWFDEVCERIVMHHPNLGESNELLPKRPGFEDTPAAGVTTEKLNDEDIDAIESEHPDKRPKFAVHKIERANQECARSGFGVWLHFDNRRNTTEYVFILYVWSVENKAIFTASPGILPVTFTAADLSIYMPMGRW